MTQCRATVRTSGYRATYPVSPYTRCSRQVCPGSQKWCWQHKPTPEQAKAQHEATMAASRAARAAREQKES